MKEIADREKVKKLKIEREKGELAKECRKMKESEKKRDERGRQIALSIEH